MAKALGSTAEEEQKQGLHKIAQVSNLYLEVFLQTKVCIATTRSSRPVVHRH